MDDVQSVSVQHTELFFFSRKVFQKYQIELQRYPCEGISTFPFDFWVHLMMNVERITMASGNIFNFSLSKADQGPEEETQNSCQTMYLLYYIYDITN